MLQTILNRLGRVTCGQALIWSVAANCVLLALLFLSVMRYPAPNPGEIEQKAAELHLDQTKGDTYETVHSR